MNRRDPRAVVALIAAVVVALAVTATFGIGRSYRDLDNPTAGLPERPAFVSAPDPMLRAEAGLDPNSTDEAPGVARSDVRTIQVRPDMIVLLQGGVPTRVIRIADPTLTPDRLTDLIGDAEWITRSAPTEVVLNAALLMEAGTTLDVAPPLRRLVLRTRPGVFVGSREATLRFTDVDVEASDRAVPRDGEVGPGTRPFVLAAGGSMQITRSAFRYLGRDWNGSYGVSWTKGAGGFATASTFEHNYLGIFAATAIDVRFDRNTLSDNTLYGINAHELSAGLLVEGNLAQRNGRTGILLSEHVSRGIVRGNTSRDNGVDGIGVSVSDDNVVTDNVVEDNRSDGIAVMGSGGTALSDNTILGNRVAIDVHGGSVGTVATGNLIDENGAATQGVDQAGNTVLSNGDAWRPVVLVIIWVVALLLIVGLVRLTRRIQRRTRHAITRSNHERALQRTGASR